MEDVKKYSARYQIGFPFAGRESSRKFSNAKIEPVGRPKSDIDEEHNSSCHFTSLVIIFAASKD
jgi:hypothetical protein